MPAAAARAGSDASPNTDHLTDLPGERTFEEHLRREIARVQRYKTVFSIALLEVDDFSAVEAGGGRGAANEVISGVADILATQTRAVDLPARTGASEFAMLFPMTPAEGGVAAVERLRDLIARTSFPEAGRPVTIAAGVAGVEEGEDVSALLNAARAALAEARDAGGNRVRPCSEGEAAADET